MPLDPNDTLSNGQYRILRQLGRGGFGFVYQAQDTLLYREAAYRQVDPAPTDGISETSKESIHGLNPGTATLVIPPAS